MKTKIILITISAILAFATLALAETWTVEFRPAFQVPTADFDDAELDNGMGFDGRVAYRVMPHVEVFTGWSWANFASDDFDFEETGYDFGARFIHPISGMKLSYLLEAAATLKHIEIEFDDEIVADSDHSLGYQLGAGVVYPVTANLAIIPSVRYNALNSEVEFDILNTKVEGDLNYLSIGANLAWKF
jgi:hypothetical protein